MSIKIKAKLIKEKCSLKTYELNFDNTNIESENEFIFDIVSPLSITYNTNLFSFRGPDDLLVELLLKIKENNYKYLQISNELNIINCYN